MKKILWSLLVLASILLSAGCHDAYLEKLDELESRTDDLLIMCNRINENLAALKALAEVIQNQDMITGITEIRNGSTVTGYRINFVQHEPITITNGADGKKPLVASRQDPDDKKYYWSVQYGDDDWEWLRAPDGSRMLAIGDLPYVTIRNGVFVYTIDGKQWYELGRADGVNGDQMFVSINTRNADYVLITLATGETLKIPTYSAFLTLKAELDKVNENTGAQVELVTAMQEKLTWITRIDPILDGTDTTGLTVALSNGKQFSIHDWTSSLSPAIFIKRDTDGHLYWAYTIGLSPEQWVLSPEGKKISAESESVDTPQVAVVRDTTDGQYYWVVLTRDSTEFLRSKVDSTWAPRAVDSVARVFSDVKSYADSLVIVLKDTTTRFVLPKQYTVSLTDEKGKTLTNVLTMKPGTTVSIRYQANGNNPALSLLTQGGFTAKTGTLESGDPCINVRAPGSFPNGTGKLMAVFTFPADPSPVTVIKTLTISKEE